MGAQPRPKIGTASLASGDLPSRAVVMLTRTFCSLLWDVVCKLSFAFLSPLSTLTFPVFHSFKRLTDALSEQCSVSAVFGPRQCLKYPHNRFKSCLCDLVRDNASVLDRIRSHVDCSPSCSFPPQPSCSDKPADIPGLPPTGRPAPAAGDFVGRIVGALPVIYATRKALPVLPASLAPVLLTPPLLHLGSHFQVGHRPFRHSSIQFVLCWGLRLPRQRLFPCRRLPSVLCCCFSHLHAQLIQDSTSTPVFQHFTKIG